MSTIGTNSEDLILNADGSGSDIKFKSNGVEKASISDAGLFTSTTIDATKLTGALPAISGAALTGVGVAGITSSADGTTIIINATENVGIEVTPESWENNYPALQIGGQGSLGGHSGSEVYVNENVYRNGGNWKHINTGAASQYTGTGGQHKFKIAPSGSADSAISWTTAMTINNSGYVTMPSQPAFYAYGGSSQNSDSKYTVEFTNTATNVGSHYNTSTYRFTAPVAGTYFFSYGWMISTENNRHHIAKNGTAVGENQYSPSTGYARVEGSAVITCAVNDYIEVKNNAASNPLESAMHGSYRYFVGHLIG